MAVSKGHYFFFFLFIQKYSLSTYKRHFIYRHLLDASTKHVSKAIQPQETHVVFLKLIFLEHHKNVRLEVDILMYFTFKLETTSINVN